MAVRYLRTAFITLYVPLQRIYTSLPFAPCIFLPLPPVPPPRARGARGLRPAPAYAVRSPRRSPLFRRRRRFACAAVGPARLPPRARTRPPSLALQPVAAATVGGDQGALEDERHARAGVELADTW